MGLSLEDKIYNDLAKHFKKPKHNLAENINFILKYIRQQIIYHVKDFENIEDLIKNQVYIGRLFKKYKKPENILKINKSKNKKIENINDYLNYIYLKILIFIKKNKTQTNRLSHRIVRGNEYYDKLFKYIRLGKYDQYQILDKLGK